MPRPIAEMSSKQIAQELANFELYRLSDDLAKRTAFEKSRSRWDALLAANETRSGFSLEVSLGVIARAPLRCVRVSCSSSSPSREIERGARDCRL